MRIIEYHSSNFAEVLKLLAMSQQDLTKKSGRVVFNNTKQRFEHYNSEEPLSSKSDEFIHVTEAINKYDKVVNQIAEAANAITLNEETDDDNYVIYDDKIANTAEESPVFSEIDDPELLKATTNNMKVLATIRQQENDARRERLTRMVAEIFGYDMVSESDIARSIVETNEMKKLMSMLFSMLGVEVSSTQVNMNVLEVKSNRLKFSPKIEYSLEVYRLGAAQALADVRSLAKAGEQIAERDASIRELTRELASERKRLGELSTQFETSQSELAKKREFNPVVPIEYAISYMEKGQVRYIYATKGDPVEDGSFPTKYLYSTSRLGKATKFTLEVAKAQIHRMIKNRGNISFTDIGEKGSKELRTFFSINRLLVEKIDEPRE